MPVAFITGITGFVGSYFAQHLLQQGYDVVGLRRTGSSLKGLGTAAEKIRWVYGDINHYEAVEEGIQQADLVVHAAALVSFDPSDKKRLYVDNVVATRQLVDICLHQTKKPDLIYISSVASIGKPDQKTELEEEEPWADGKELAYYTVSKYLAEQEVWRAIAEGLSALIVNPSVIIGRGDYTRSSLKLIKHIQDEPRYYPIGMANVVDIRDVVAITWDLYVQGIRSERFILNGASLSYRQLFLLFAQAFAVKAASKPLTKSMASVLWRANRLAAVIPFVPYRLTKSLLNSAMQPYVYKADKSQRYATIPYRPLADTIAWIAADAGLLK